MNYLCKLKGSNAKSTSSNIFDVDSCGLPQDADESTIYEQLSLTLDKESSNTVHSKVQKTLKNKKISLMSRHALINRNDTTCDGLTIKWNETENDELGNKKLQRSRTMVAR